MKDYYQSLQKKYLILLVTLSIISFIYFFAYFFISHFNTTGQIIIFLVHVFLLLITLFFFCLFTNLFIKKTKTKLVTFLIDDTYEPYYFDEKKSIDDSLVSSSHFFKEDAIHSSKNFLEGKYNDIFFKSSDLKVIFLIIFLPTAHSVEGIPILAFNGRFIVFNIRTTSRYILKITQKKRYFEKENLVMLDNNLISIDPIYHIYTNDIDLTIKLFSSLDKNLCKLLRDKYPGKLLLTFKNEQLFIGLKDSKNHLSTTLFHSYEKMVELLNKDIQIYKSIIDALDLPNLKKGL